MKKVSYKEFLEKNKVCPFCDLKKYEIIKENKYAILTLAQTPYTNDHLLVVPKEHHLKLSSMTKAEKDALNKLVYEAIELLYKKHKSVNILYREGVIKKSGKTINHLHYHIIPKLKIGAYEILGRGMITDDDFAKLTEKFIKRFL